MKMSYFRPLPDGALALAAALPATSNYSLHMRIRNIARPLPRTLPSLLTQLPLSLMPKCPPCASYQTARVPSPLWGLTQHYTYSTSHTHFYRNYARLGLTRYSNEDVLFSSPPRRYASTGRRPPRPLQLHTAHAHTQHSTPFTANTPISSKQLPLSNVKVPSLCLLPDGALALVAALSAHTHYSLHMRIRNTARHLPRILPSLPTQLPLSLMPKCPPCASYQTARVPSPLWELTQHYTYST